MYDQKIENGTIIDGTKGAAYKADIGITDGVIRKIGNLGGVTARKTLDAKGKIVTPGFINMHSHSDCTAHMYPDLQNLAVQGITTAFTGHCGLGVAPIFSWYQSIHGEGLALERATHVPKEGFSPGYAPFMLAEPFKRAFRETHGFDMPWGSWGQYIEYLNKEGLGVNLISVVGHAQLRIQVMGYDHVRVATDDEVRRMCEMLDECLEQGAFGVGFGMEYAPGIYADTREYTELARVVAKHGGIVTAHTQMGQSRYGKIDPKHTTMDGYREFLEIGRESGAHVHISHVKHGFATPGLPDERLLPKSVELTLELLEEYRGKGVEVTWDMLADNRHAVFSYPHLASAVIDYVEECGGLTPFAGKLREPVYRGRLLREIRGGRNPGRKYIYGVNLGGGEGSPGYRRYEGMRITSCALRSLQGRTLGDLSEAWGKDLADTILEILSIDPLVTAMSPREGEGEDTKLFAAESDASFGLDEIGCNYEKVERPDMPPYFPGNVTDYSGMPYILTAGFCEKKEEIVARVTGNAAKALGLRDRGLIKEGLRADIVVLDWDNIDPNVNYADPVSAPKGIEQVFVGGKLAAQSGISLDARAGKMELRNEVD